MYYTVVLILLKLSDIVCYVDCYSFNTNDVIFISENSVKNTYFSYSLLLQGGETLSSLIIGAPRNNNNLQAGGDIYKCNIDIGGETSCVQYPTGRSISSTGTNGNFFGMSLDGDDYVNGALVACAPRTVTSNNINVNSLRGVCMYIRNSSQITEHPVEIKPLSDNSRWHDSVCCDALGRSYYDFAFAMAGFDISFDSETKEVLLGAPGVKKFNGATISYSVEDQGTSLLPSRHKPVQMEEDTYFGYSVETAKFKKFNKKTALRYIAGAPRSNDLTGEVTIFYYDPLIKEKMNKVVTLYGKEVGAYFGASILALDVTNDEIVDLLIGAPTSAGRTWDEGNVQVYEGRSENSFMLKETLTGSSQNGGRFGSAIASLGDFDLDGYNDVAISAPYEDNGMGAVYIYRGGAEGLKDPYSQRLSPIDFNVRSANVQGFGMGISRGSDIDANGHNDIAIGAYKSDQVFIVKSLSMIDYKFLLRPSINTITDDTAFDVQFCLWYTKRSEKNILSRVTFNLSIDLDYRSVEGRIVDHIDVGIGQIMCKNYTVHIASANVDILPFQIHLKLDTDRKDIIAHGENYWEHKIPYSHGCGSDNICTTNFSVQLVTESQQVVLGFNNQVKVNVQVDNSGEPAYQCQVKIEIPDGIELTNQEDCLGSGRNYACLIDERLVGFSEKEYTFDIKNIKPDITAIDISVEVISLFKNNGSRNRASLKIPVLLEATAYVVGKSIPESVEFELKNTIKDVEVVYEFSVVKTGPSPLKLAIDILLPIIEHDGQNVFDISEVKGSIDSIHVPCTRSIIHDDTDLDFEEMDFLKVPLNRTMVLLCNKKENCQKYVCGSEYLYNLAQVARFKVRMLIRSNLLVSKFKSELTTKDLIALIPVIFQNSPSGRVGASSLFLISVYGVQMIPLWVYLVAPIMGIILLLLMSYGLYRCHFFDRVYKDKLDQEKILGPDSGAGSVEDEIFDDVVFRPMEETKGKGYL